MLRVVWNCTEITDTHENKIFLRKEMALRLEIHIIIPLKGEEERHWKRAPLREKVVTMLYRLAP